MNLRKLFHWSKWDDPAEYDWSEVARRKRDRDLNHTSLAVDYKCSNTHLTTLWLTRDQKNELRSKLVPEEILCGACGFYSILTPLAKSLRDIDESARAVREYKGVMPNA